MGKVKYTDLVKDPECHGYSFNLPGRKGRRNEHDALEALHRKITGTLRQLNKQHVGRVTRFCIGTTSTKGTMRKDGRKTVFQLYPSNEDTFHHKGIAHQWRRHMQKGYGRMVVFSVITAKTARRITDNDDAELVARELGRRLRERCDIDVRCNNDDCQFAQDECPEHHSPGDTAYPLYMAFT